MVLYCGSPVYSNAVIELSAEIAALQIAVLNTRQELKHDLRNDDDPAGSKLNTSAGSNQKEANVC